MINKKAGIGAGITWIVAILIIVFIIIIFFVFAGILGLTKGGIEIDKESGDNYLNLVLIEELENFLDKEVEFEGRDQKVLDAIKASLDVYFETKDEQDQNKILADWIYSDNVFKDLNYEKNYLSGYNSETISQIINQNNDLAKKLDVILKSYCADYKLQLPTGVIEEGGRPVSPLLNLDEGVYIESYTPWASIKFPYRGKIFEIKYKRLRKC